MKTSENKIADLSFKRIHGSFTFFILIFFFFFSSSQTPIQVRSLDSLKQKFQTDSAHIFRFQKYQSYFSIDNRNSFIKSAPVNVQGIQIGIIVNERHTFGIGGYMIKEESAKPVKVKDHSISANQYLNINYLTAFYQFEFIDKRFFGITIPIEVGLGKFDLKLEDSISGKIYYDRKGGFLPIGGGLQIELKPTRWIGVQGMIGYRYVPGGNIKFNFNGMYYSYGIWFDFRQIMRDVNFYYFKRPKYHKQIKHILAS